MAWIIGSVINVLVLVFFVYLVAKLYKYILRLEDKLEEAVNKNENMFQSLKELVAEDILLKDGRLKKFSIQSDRNKIYNGLVVEDQEIDF